MDLKEIGVDVMNWIVVGLAHDRNHRIAIELLNIPISSQLPYYWKRIFLDRTTILALTWILKKWASMR